MTAWYAPSRFFVSDAPSPHLAGFDHKPPLSMCFPLNFRQVSAWLVCMLVVSGSDPAWSQLRMEHPVQVAAEAFSTVVTYATWEGTKSPDGLVLSTPSDWEIQEILIPETDGTAHTRPVPFSRLSDGVYRVDEDSFRLGPGQTVAVRIRTGADGAGRVRIVPLERSRGSLDQRPDLGTEIEWDLVKRPIRASNHSLQLLAADDARPEFVLEVPVRTLFEGDWTTSFWVQTTTTGSTILSSWSGREGDVYPFEFVVDPLGRLAAYLGTGSQHFGMRSGGPVADGSWHHVVLTREAETRRMVLNMDGEPVDSLILPPSVVLPSRAAHIRLGDRPGVSGETFVFRGELDEVAFYSGILDRQEILSLRTQSRIPDRQPAWHLSFERADGFVASDAGRSWTVAGSLLSFRQGPTDLQVIPEAEGLRLSFVSGDVDVLEYRIARSFDGAQYQTVATLLPLVEDQNRLDWVDRTLPDGVVYYRIIPVYEDGPGKESPAIKAGIGTEQDLSSVRLEGNFPNPFNPTTTIRFEVLEPQVVRVSVWDLSGQMVASLVDGQHAPGRYEVGFQADQLPSGTYFVRLESATGIQTHQMILMK